MRTLKVAFIHADDCIISCSLRLFGIAQIKFNYNYNHAPDPLDEVGCLDSLERGTVEWNSGTVEWNSGMGNYD